MSLPQELSRMSMGGMSGKANPHACKISMLWNWYTVDSCFIARSWHNKSKGAFAGSCIGVFFLVLVSQWLHRFAREYDSALITKYSAQESADNSKLEMESSKSATIAVNPAVHAISHRWLFAPVPASGIMASPFEHLIRCVLFTIEWGLSYIIMLLFMYYNGYIIICCILGAFAGRLLFTYNEPLNGSCLSDSQDMDKKCCR
ncbi:putative copper transport protein [Clavispora lusitaniae]|uniref:Copper transport protein n=3 Tax=Clavispora lusitaniae TaxID=36911 RepID=C4Y2E1_CLAL4|nr:uncharacterized protein CLUG_02704 [Clavispora lusitaniae ATCC 42720]KAF7580029.1 Ctr copper transporter family protein [Clavispora lusitaniae]EEQ38578.1 hypothetical protein CLUG_02704 [Clavispora lusitaniae ATCC 42720]OVF08682.1 putative copper transport protein CTR3 [Clavispora lusitaniae]QFZ27587.1 putative copper transport protein [Clavispora lusitaniae]QFZ33106.1 putative copper transport protein [Clavispora lusitaniae]